jgi:hypothetical protein
MHPSAMASCSVARGAGITAAAAETTGKRQCERGNGNQSNGKFHFMFPFGLLA